IVKEIQQTIPNEFNFQREAAFMTTVRHNLACRGFHQVVCPTPVLSLCTRRMIVMERLYGTPFTKLIDSLHPYKDSSLLPPRLAAMRLEAISAIRSLLESYGAMFFLDGVFHADPHPGNLLLLPGAKLGLLDFGQSKVLERQTKRSFARMVVALCKGNQLEIALALLGTGISFGGEADWTTFFSKPVEESTGARAGAEEGVKDGKVGGEAVKVEPMMNGHVSESAQCNGLATVNSVAAPASAPAPAAPAHAAPAPAPAPAGLGLGSGLGPKRPAASGSKAASRDTVAAAAASTCTGTGTATAASGGEAVVGLPGLGPRLRKKKTVAFSDPLTLGPSASLGSAAAAGAAAGMPAAPTKSNLIAPAPAVLAASSATPAAAPAVPTAPFSAVASAAVPAGSSSATSPAAAAGGSPVLHGVEGGTVSAAVLAAVVAFTENAPPDDAPAAATTAAAPAAVAAAAGVSEKGGEESSSSKAGAGRGESDGESVLATLLKEVGPAGLLAAATPQRLQTVQTLSYLMFDTRPMAEAQTSPLAQESVLQRAPLKAFNQSYWLWLQTVQTRSYLMVDTCPMAEAQTSPLAQESGLQKAPLKAFNHSYWLEWGKCGGKGGGGNVGGKVVGEMWGERWWGKGGGGKVVGERGFQRLQLVQALSYLVFDPMTEALMPRAQESSVCSHASSKSSPQGFQPADPSCSSSLPPPPSPLRVYHVVRAMLLLLRRLCPLS
ncbi:unnamed protein product, partial [Closterium sp. NIES-53]